jgi:hypothetical protein
MNEEGNIGDLYSSIDTAYARGKLAGRAERRVELSTDHAKWRAGYEEAVAFDHKKWTAAIQRLKYLVVESRRTTEEGRWYEQAQCFSTVITWIEELEKDLIGGLTKEAPVAVLGGAHVCADPGLEKRLTNLEIHSARLWDKVKVHIGDTTLHREIVT